MKKHLTLIAAAAATLSAAAGPAVFSNNADINAMPEEVSFNGENNIVCGVRDEYFKILDTDLKEKVHIKLEGMSEYQLKQWRQSREYTYADPTLESTTETGGIIEIDGNDLNISLNQALDYYNQNWPGYAEKGTFNGETVIVTAYFEEGYYEKKYVRVFFKLVDGRWTEFQNNYQMGEWGPYGDWTEREEEIRTYTTSLASDIDFDINGKELHSAYVTQTLFNNDKNFEYIVPMYKKTTFSEETKYEKWGGETLVCTGFEVKSQDGSTFLKLDIPEEYQSSNYYVSEPYVTAMFVGTKKYLLLKLNGNTVVYDLDGMSGIKAPALVVEGSMTVHPTLPRRGETVTVDLGTAAQPDCRIAVTAVNGRNALTLKAKTGESSVSIPTASLASGMYIVTATNGTSATEAAKIIIR